MKEELVEIVCKQNVKQAVNSELNMAKLAVKNVANTATQKHRSMAMLRSVLSSTSFEFTVRYY